MRIPFVDLQGQIRAMRREIEHSFQRVLQNPSFILGREVELFEKEFAKYCGAQYCVAVNSGTSALHLALLAHGVGSGDEVITQPNTYIATAEAISYTGAKPVFVDVDPGAYTIDISKIEKAMSPRTKAVIPVHLYGNATDMDKLSPIAKKHGLAVIEDACQAHGTTYKGRKIGSLGNTTCFSFYPSKVLGAYGEGGAVITKSKDIYEKIQILRNHGQAKKNQHIIIGYNYRMQEFQAAFLRAKLKHLDQWIKMRRRSAQLYNKLLSGMEAHITIAEEPSYSRSSFYVYAVRCRNRDKLMNYLAKNGVQIQVHYPTPIHLQRAYRFLGFKKGDFPIAEKQAKEIISLPMYPELRERQIKYVAEQIKEFYGSKHISHRSSV